MSIRAFLKFQVYIPVRYGTLENLMLLNYFDNFEPENTVFFISNYDLNLYNIPFDAYDCIQQERVFCAKNFSSIPILLIHVYEKLFLLKNINWTPVSLMHKHVHSKSENFFLSNLIMIPEILMHT